MNLPSSSLALFFDTSMAFCQYKVWLRAKAPDLEEQIFRCLR
jgi:hypothetical protein